MTEIALHDRGDSGGVYEAGVEEAPLRNCFAVLVDNEPGVLARVVGMISGRGYNIDSLTVDAVDTAENLSRITIVTTGAPIVVEQIKAQLGRLIPVRRVVNLTVQGRLIEGCLAYIKFIGDFDQRDAAKLIARKLGARIVDTTDNTIIFELTTDTGKIDQMIAELGPLGQIEIARTGSVALGCGAEVLSVLPQPIK